MVRVPPPALSNLDRGMGAGDRTSRAWAIVRDAYLEAAAALTIDDPDRVLMLEQGRLAAQIAGLPWRVLRAAPRTARASSR